MNDSERLPFERLDFMGTRVAMVELSDEPPRILLADHVEGEPPILVYRVAALDVALDKLASRGWEQGATLEIWQGPCRSFRAQGGQRIAVYERSRPDVEAHFVGRRDF